MVIYIGKKTLTLLPILMCGKPIELVSKFKLLGIFFNNKLTWDVQVEYVCSKPSRSMAVKCGILDESTPMPSA